MLRPLEVFDISPKQIRAKYPCSIVIDEKEYDKYSFLETSTKFQIPGILEFFFPEFEDYCNIVLNYSVDVLKTQTLTIEKNTTIIYYEKGDLIITKDYVPTSTDIALLIRLLQGHVKYAKDPKVMLNMLHDILPSIDLIHLELVVSNMYRVFGKEEERCRINGDYSNSSIYGVRKQPFLDSWKSALAFQYIDKAIQTGLVRGKSSEMNPIEKILNEDFKSL